MHICVYIYICVPLWYLWVPLGVVEVHDVYIYIYIYIEREREIMCLVADFYFNVETSNNERHYHIIESNILSCLLNVSNII